MNKRIICVLLVFLCVFNLNGCDESKTLSNEQKCIAVLSDSGEAIAAKMYIESTDYQLTEYQSSSDAVVALENGKADYVVLNEYEAQDFIDAECEIIYFDKCEHKLECRAIFNLENEALCREFNKAFLELEENGILEKIKRANIKGEEYRIPQSSGEKGEITMICDPIFDDRVYYDENNELKGTDVDIAKTVCAYLGYNLIIENADFDVMFTELERGNVDFIMSSAEYTEARAEHFLFSDVYATLEYNVYKRKQ